MYLYFSSQSFKQAAASKVAEHAAKVKCKNKISRCHKKIDPSVLLSAAKTEIAAVRKAKREEKKKKRNEEVEVEVEVEEKTNESKTDSLKKKNSILTASAKKAAADALAVAQDGKRALRHPDSNGN